MPILRDAETGNPWFGVADNWQTTGRLGTCQRCNTRGTGRGPGEKARGEDPGVRDSFYKEGKTARSAAARLIRTYVDMVGMAGMAGMAGIGASVAGHGTLDRVRESVLDSANMFLDSSPVKRCGSVSRSQTMPAYQRQIFSDGAVPAVWPIIRHLLVRLAWWPWISKNGNMLSSIRTKLTNM